jgi:hypothetical protein
VRLTWDEWDLLDRLAVIRRITIEELIRDELRLRPIGTEPQRTRKRHLQVVRPESAA